MHTNVDLAILGGGSAGYSAAIYAARANLSTVVFEQAMPGGQITTTDSIENYPGIPSISGAELGMRFQEHADAAGAETRYSSVEAVSRDEGGTFTICYDDGEALTAKAIIVATGAVPRPVGSKVKIPIRDEAFLTVRRATACSTKTNRCSLSAVETRLRRRLVLNEFCQPRHHGHPS